MRRDGRSVRGIGSCAAWTLLAVLVVASGAQAQRRGRSKPSKQDETQTQLEEQQQQIEALRQELDQQRAALAEQKQALSDQQQALAEQRRALEAQRKAAPSKGGASDEDAQLEAILAGAKSGEGGGDQGEAAQVQAFEPSFRVYGFADMGLQRFWGTELLEGNLGSEKTTFALGNVNFYFDAEPVKDWRFLAEVRFSLLPDGTEDLINAVPGQPVEPTDTTVKDPTNPSGGFAEVRWGGIVLERAHIDYSPRDWLQFQVGYFLTPYGIWNVDHGTPTLISTTYPGFQMVEVFPRHQLGVDVHGSVHQGAWEYGYHLYVSNGRTPGQLDLTDNKNFGARFVVRATRPVRLQLGVSGFVGWYDQDRKIVQVAPDGHATVDIIHDVHYAEQGIGGDISLDAGDFRLRAEAVARRVRYDDDRRGVYMGVGPPADRVEAGAYLLMSYLLPWWGLEPLVFMDFLKWPTFIGEGILLPSAGLNIHFNPAVVLKLQYSYMFFVDFSKDLPPVRDEHLNLLLARLAIAF